jgi:hypothetical protein
MIAPTDWAELKVLYYWRQGQNDIQIARLISKDIERAEDMRGKFGIGCVFFCD